MLNSLLNLISRNFSVNITLQVVRVLKKSYCDLKKNILKIYQIRNESHINQYYTYMYTTSSTFILLY